MPQPVHRNFVFKCSGKLDYKPLVKAIKPIACLDTMENHKSLRNLLFRLMVAFYRVSKTCTKPNRWFNFITHQYYQPQTNKMIKYKYIISQEVYIPNLNVQICDKYC